MSGCEAKCRQAHLLPLQAAEPELPDLSVCVGCIPSLSILELLQVVQSASQAKGSTVEVAATYVKGEQELAGHHQLAAPAG